LGVGSLLVVKKRAVSKASAPVQKRGRGRPSTYTPEKAAEILRLLSTGSTVTQMYKAMGITADAVIAWRAAHKDFAEAYALAREQGFDTMADATIAIADDGRNDTQTDQHGNKIVLNDVVNRSRLRVDTRKWFLSKVNPRKYGDKVAVDLATPPGEAVRIIAAPSVESLAILSEILGPLLAAPADPKEPIE
jgi:hypothetical protein